MILAHIRETAANTGATESPTVQSPLQGLETMQPNEPLLGPNVGETVEAQPLPPQQELVLHQMMEPELPLPETDTSIVHQMDAGFGAGTSRSMEDYDTNGAPLLAPERQPAGPTTEVSQSNQSLVKSDTTRNESSFLLNCV